MKASTLCSTNSLMIFPVVVLLLHAESYDTKLQHSPTQQHRERKSRGHCWVADAFIYCVKYTDSSIICHPPAGQSLVVAWRGVTSLNGWHHTAYFSMIDYCNANVCLSVCLNAVHKLHLMDFSSDGPLNVVAKFEIRIAFPVREIIGGWPKKMGNPWIRPRSLFSKIFNGILFEWILWIYWPNLKSVSFPDPERIGVPKIFGQSLDTCPRFLFSKIFHGLLFGWTLLLFWPNLKFVALPVPEIIAIGVLGGVWTPNLEKVRP